MKHRVAITMLEILRLHKDFRIEKKKGAAFSTISQGERVLVKLRPDDVSDLLSQGWIREKERSESGRLIVFEPTQYMKDLLQKGLQ